MKLLLPPSGDKHSHPELNQFARSARLSAALTASAASSSISESAVILSSRPAHSPSSAAGSRRIVASSDDVRVRPSINEFIASACVIAGGRRVGLFIGLFNHGGK